MTAVLPAPPNGEKYWSIVTLAEHLRVLPAAVDARLSPAENGVIDESRDFAGPHRVGSYTVDTPDGRVAHFGDAYLTDEAAERIAAQLPAARIARAVLAEQAPEITYVSWPQMRAMAAHILGVLDPKTTS